MSGSLKDSYSHTCVVFNGTDAKAVAYAVRFIGTSLCSCKRRRGEMALLICKRSSWDSAVRVLGTKMTDSFEGDLCADIDSKCCDAMPIYKILRSCFKKCSTSKDQSYSYQEKMNLTYEQTNETLVDLDRIGANLGDSERRVQKDNLNNSRDGHLRGKGIREENLKKLLVRFVDDKPLNIIKSEGSTICDTACNPGGLLWSYIGAANDISVHLDNITLVVVAGLTQMQTNRPVESDRFVDINEPCRASTMPHPFTAIGVAEHGDCFHRTYNTKCILRYALSIATTVSALNRNDNFPNFVLFEMLPTDPSDEKKFISFLSERFGCTYRLC